MGNLYCALVHHPVKSRTGETVTTAVTNLDVHDIARSARTYGLSGYFIVTPIEAQWAIVDRILSHWREGPGTRRVPERGEALKLVRLEKSIEDARAKVREIEGEDPFVIVTTAKAPKDLEIVGFSEGGVQIRERQRPTLLLFGTGHGLMPETLASADQCLAPIRPGGGYNHLSVRAAAAICFDRLIGDEISFPDRV